MAPSAIAEHPVREEVIVPKTIEIVPFERKHVSRPEDHRQIKPAFKFSQAVLLDENHFKTGSRSLKLAVSILTHVAVISIPILLGLFFTDTINIKQYASMILAAPPPPPPPPPPANQRHHQGRAGAAKVHYVRQTLRPDGHSQANG